MMVTARLQLEDSHVIEIRKQSQPGPEQAQIHSCLGILSEAGLQNQGRQLNHKKLGLSPGRLH
jgi:hypothetical protein